MSRQPTLVQPHHITSKKKNNLITSISHVCASSLDYHSTLQTATHSLFTHQRTKYAVYSVYFGPHGPFWSNQSNSVNCGLFRFTLVHSVHFSDALRGDVCVESRATSLTVMSHSQHNITRFLIKLYFSYVISLLFFNISDEFIDISILLRSFKSYKT